MKKAIAVLLFCALLAPELAARADSGVYTGEVVSTEAVNVLAPCDGTLCEIALTAGQTVAAGALVAQYQTEKVYATGDGTVTAVWTEVGAQIDGAVMEIEPIEKYTIYATTDGAYEGEETLAVHAGEAVYLKCTTDGTHRGTGTVTQIDGTDYTVVTTGGAFYVGETVYLYRDADFTSTEKIGIGTLIYTDNVQYESEGTLVALHVQAGERVERGQLLYEVLGADSAEIAAPVSGIVASVLPGNAGDSTSDAEDSAQGSASAPTSMDSAAGMGGSAPASDAAGNESSSTSEESTATGDSAVSEGDVIAVIYPEGSLRVQISIPEEEFPALTVGASVLVLFADDDETAVPGVVEKISSVAEDGAYAALIRVERAALYLGMTCSVFTE